MLASEKVTYYFMHLTSFTSSEIHLAASTIAVVIISVAEEASNCFAWACAISN